MDRTIEVSSTATNTPVSLNIDQMLNSLGKEEKTAAVHDFASSTLNIDSLSKPLPVISPSLLPGKQSVIDSSGYIVLKKVGAFLLTIVLLCVAYWFLSVQYPVESKDYTDKILGFFQTSVSVVSDNMSADSSSTLSSGNTIHMSASDPVINSYDNTATPLADALMQAQGSGIVETSTEHTLDDAFQSSGALVTLSGSTSTGSDDLIKKQLLREDLILAKQKSDTYISHSVGSTTSLKLSIARAISKKSDSLSIDLESSGVDLKSIDYDLSQLKILLQRLDN